MPLIILSGFPTSGKTTRAKQLHAYLTERIQTASSSTTSPDPSSPASSSPSPAATAAAKAPKYKLHLISDDTLAIPRTVYDLSSTPEHTRSANASEKDARAATYGAVKRVLSERDVVILDGLNYIKGWRYQLYCEARAVRTGSCVVQVGCGVERAKGVNLARLERRNRREGAEGSEEVDGAEPYEPEIWENLVYRYEEPNAMSRWDSPLFTLIWDDGPERTRQVFDSIWEAIAGDSRKVVKPNQATIQRGRDTGTDYLYVLDRETQEIVKRILEAQQGGEGGEVKIPKGSGKGAEDLVVDVPAGIGLPRMQRLRRAFVGMNRGGMGLEGVGNLACERITESFVGYLNDAFEREG